MEVLSEIVDLINECGNALNLLQHHIAESLLEQIDKKLENNSVPLDIRFYRLKLSTELAKRVGNCEKALNEIEESLQDFQERPDFHFELLIIAGKLEASFNRLNISTIYLTEALGLAEDIGNNSMVAEAYSAIAQMFAPKYKGLSFYFFRKAERSLMKIGKTKEADAIRMERALLSITYFLDNRNEKSNRLQREANRIVNSLDISGFNAHQPRRYRYIKAVITADEDELEQLICEMRSCGALPDACRFGDVYMGICIEKGLFNKAYRMLESHKKDFTSYHGESQDLTVHIEKLDYVISNKITVPYLPFKIVKTETDKTTILDILDKYSIADELWALEEGWMRQLFPSYNEEGLFDAIRMPDNTVRLYPCGIAFNIYYRGQAVYYEESYPSLYREHVSEAERFVERIKYEELKNCVDSFPLSYIYRNNIYFTAPDKSLIHLPLSIDYLALAQHYGIKTELMDITADKFVAAFFATTEVLDGGEYVPIVDNRNSKGVFYRCQDPGLLMPTGRMSKLRAVGLQPFSRPGEQAGLVYEMAEGENFNDIVISKEFFSHDKEASEFIFNYTNRSKKLFPNSSLEIHANAIRSSNVFSSKAFLEARKDFYSDKSDEFLSSYLKNQGIIISDEVDFSFTAEEKNQCVKDWSEGGERELLSKILVRPVYMGDDYPIYGPETLFNK